MPSSYLTLAQFRELVTTSLSDEALAILLDAAAQEIYEAAGAAGETTEWLHGNGHLLGLSRPVDTITSVVENDVTLADDDYELSTISQMVLRRTDDGTNPRHHWGWRVDVTYTPADDLATRQRVQAELVKLSLATDPNLASQRLGDWAETYVSNPKSPAEQRADILATLDVPVPFL
jgi:hypothetical protein